jgi:hypothetical protein
MQEQHRRLDSFMANVEERLGGLEAAVSQLALNSDPELARRTDALLSQRERMERERERDRERSPPPPPFYASPKPAKSDLKKKKKKKTIVPEYEREISRSTVPDLGYRTGPPAGDEVLPPPLLLASSLLLRPPPPSHAPSLTPPSCTSSRWSRWSCPQVDEELARKLQAQFNAEAEIEALKKESITLSDEEYAQRLQVRTTPPPLLPTYFGDYFIFVYFLCKQKAAYPGEPSSSSSSCSDMPLSTP